jgi:hypothetical protein
MMAPIVAQSAHHVEPAFLTGFQFEGGEVPRPAAFST